MAKLDAQWAIEEIDEFIHTTDWVTKGSGSVRSYGMRGSALEAVAGAHVVEQILDRVLPGWSVSRPDVDDRRYTWLRNQASRAKVTLLRADELAEKLGDDAPDMDAANLHPWAWENGKSFWRTGHHHQAVMQAAIRVNAETQVKVGRMDISETDLFNQCFSLDDPKPDAPRLRLAENDGSKTYANLHKGARALAEGLYTAIRNPGMHTPSPADGGEEQLALEQLAAFSLLARWVSQASVARS